MCGRLPLAPRTARTLFVAVISIGIGLHSVRTLVRNPDWESLETLFLHDLDVVPNSAKAINNADAITWGKKTEHAKAVEMF